jgi:4-amino-4-deoxy-L-arabinose transferase-like glycosyltransferase
LTHALARRVTDSWRLQSLLFLTGVLLVGALLLLCRLDDTYLWQDEAETAIVSRHLLAHGLPLSTDGTDWVQQAAESFVEFTDDYVWIYHSWLQYALTAAAFAVLGPTTFAARLPFVLVGLATLCYFYGFVSRWLVDKRVARVAAVLLLFCVPFLLLLRQCRYYALAAFFTLVTLDAYLRLARQQARVRLSDPRATLRQQSDEQWAVPYFVLSALLLYHSHYGAFFPTMAALGVHLLLSRVERKALQRFLFAFLLVAVLVLPWASFMRVWNRGQPFQMDRFLAHTAQHFLYVTAWLFPLILVPVLLIAYLRRCTERGPARRFNRHGFGLNPPEATFCQVAGLVVLVNILFLSASAAFDWVFFRYLAHLIPLLLTLLAVVVVRIMERWGLAAHALLVVLVVSNGMHMLPYGLPGLKQLDLGRLRQGSPAFDALNEAWIKAGRFRSDLWMYAQELTHSYRGPNEGLLAHLAVHGKPGQTIAVNYEDLPLIFYSKLRVLGGLSSHGLAADLRPDWVIDRKHGPYRDRLAALVASGSYERVEIPYPDIRWENRPQPGEHHYLTVQDEDNVVLYRRQGD